MQSSENLSLDRPEHQRAVGRLDSLLEAQKDKAIVKIGGLDTKELTVDDHVSVGSNGKTIVRDIKKDQYTGPSAQDFINRGKSLYLTTLEMMGKDETQSPESLKKAWENFCVTINQKCQIDPSKMKSMNSQETLDYFAPIYDEAKTLLTQFTNTLCQDLINNQVAVDNKKKITDIKKWENYCLMPKRKGLLNKAGLILLML